MEHLVFPLADSPSTAIPTGNVLGAFLLYCAKPAQVLSPASDSGWSWEDGDSLTEPHLSYRSPHLYQPCSGSSSSRVKAWDSDLSIQCEMTVSLMTAMSSHFLYLLMWPSFPLTQKYCSTKGRDGSTSKSLSCKGSGFIFTWAEIFFF